MKAENILLTHFSTRYPKPPAVSPRHSQNATAAQPNIVMAFDLARIRVSEMHRFKAYLPAIQRCLSDTVEEEITS
jgi:ribonuclease Z